MVLCYYFIIVEVKKADPTLGSPGTLIFNKPWIVKSLRIHFTDDGF